MRTCEGNNEADGQGYSMALLGTGEVLGKGSEQEGELNISLGAAALRGQTSGCCCSHAEPQELFKNFLTWMTPGCFS